ncbi:MAG: histidine kinase [Clostridiales bacterium]|nr:histidine kinase [Clostridiales bacterium]
MDTGLRDGDFAVSEGGIPLSVEGLEEVLQQARIRLTVKQGSFSYDPKLGSQLDTLRKDAPDGPNQALHLVQEALSPLVSVQVKGVRLTDTGALVDLLTPYGEGQVEILLWEEDEDGSADL